MALRLETLNRLEGLLLSDRVTYRGHELSWITSTLQEIQRERATILSQSRASPSASLSNIDRAVASAQAPQPSIPES